MEETRGVSRRSFLKGAALAGVGAATASMFAGVRAQPKQRSRHRNGSGLDGREHEHFGGFDRRIGQSRVVGRGSHRR